MTEPWTFSGEIARVGQDLGPVTLLEGSSFCLSNGMGDIVAGSAQGLFFLDTRFLSRYELRVDGQPVESLGVAVDEPFSAVFFGRSHPEAGQADSGLVVFRRRYVGRGMREDLEIRNHGSVTREVAVDLCVAADFADLFEVKEDRVRHRGAYSSELEDTFIRFGHRRGGAERDVTVSFSEPADVDVTTAAWRFELPPNGSWSICIGVAGSVDSRPVEPRYRCGEPIEAAKHVRRMAEWREQVPIVASDAAPLVAAVRRASEDLAALRIFDPDHPELPVIAAGAPWFMALFGRDSLITAWMALLVDPRLARGVLETLARLQGTKVDPETDEEPGKILHEVRFAASGSLSFDAGDAYYGSVDATPLFVMLLGELHRWGCEPGVIERLLPHADRALEWIRTYGDRDDDGFVEYARGTARGLANQGWKDSWDGIRFADGRVAEAPIALCEVQGYVYAAFRARAHLAREAGDQALSEEYVNLARDLKERFNRQFWMTGRDWFAVGLDHDKRPIDALASNMGQCLWTGIVDEHKAGMVARHLLSPEMFCGWGVRTMATSMGGYNPVSYHCGSVWPHDNALAAAGLMRYGFVDEAHRLIEGLLDVTTRRDGRLPELFAGVARDEVAVPAAYPTSCVPQAWAAASPLLLLRAMLRLEPWMCQGRVWLAPALPRGVGRLCVENIRLGKDRITIHADDTGVRVDGNTAGVEIIAEPCPPTLD